MKHVSIYRAQERGGVYPEPLQITIGTVLPDPTVGRDATLPEWRTASGALLDSDAEQLADALTEALPGGTLLRLTALLMEREAARCHIVVPVRGRAST